VVTTQFRSSTLSTIYTSSNKKAPAGAFLVNKPRSQLIVSLCCAWQAEEDFGPTLARDMAL
jgi:hypothetical protein